MSDCGGFYNLKASIGGAGFVLPAPEPARGIDKLAKMYAQDKKQTRLIRMVAAGIMALLLILVIVALCSIGSLRAEVRELQEAVGELDERPDEQEDHNQDPPDAQEQDPTLPAGNHGGEEPTQEETQPEETQRPTQPEPTDEPTGPEQTQPLDVTVELEIKNSEYGAYAEWEEADLGPKTLADGSNAANIYIFSNEIQAGDAIKITLTDSSEDGTVELEAKCQAVTRDAPFYSAKAQYFWYYMDKSGSLMPLGKAGELSGDHSQILTCGADFWDQMPQTVREDGSFRLVLKATWVEEETGDKLTVTITGIEITRDSGIRFGAAIGVTAAEDAGSTMETESDSGDTE